MRRERPSRFKGYDDADRQRIYSIELPLPAARRWLSRLPSRLPSRATGHHSFDWILYRGAGQGRLLQKRIWGCSV